MYFLYTLIYSLVIFCLLPFEYLKRPGETRKRWLKEKFGFIETQLSGRGLTSPGENCIWIHAVSVGEVMAATPLVKRICKEYPSADVIISTITDTGQKVARENMPDARIIYLPFDIPFVLRNAMKRVKPELFIIVETELWPNLVRVFSTRGIPVIMLNGRISEKSFRGYMKISFFMRRILDHLDFFGMQGEDYAERIRLLGAAETKISSLGNFKFDAHPLSRNLGWTEALKGPVIVAGSTHEGEEELIASIYNGMRNEFPEITLIIAPRHPERFRKVEETLLHLGVSFVRRSNLPDDADLSGRVVLLDSMGELSTVYGKADIVIMGKSFRGHGGQNPLEPAYWGKPVICGPHMENFPVIRDFYSASAAREVKEEDLADVLRSLLRSPGEGREMGRRAQQLCEKNAGAVEKAMKVIAKYVRPPVAKKALNR